MKSKVIGVIIILCCIIFGIAIYFSGDDISFDKVDYVIVDGEEIQLDFDDTVSVNFWNEEEILFNDEEMSEIKLFNDIGIGSHIDEVEKVFDLNESNCFANMEVDDELMDGTTDIVEDYFVRSKTIDKYDYLDCYLYFGFKKVDDKWVRLKTKELRKYLRDDVKSKDIIVYYIGFNGLSGEAVDVNEVIAFGVNYLGW